MMKVKEDYLLIEFSDKGDAFYAYKLSNPIAPKFDEPKINSINDLKNSSMKMLVYRRGYEFVRNYPEGRLSHRDGDIIWEDCFAFWLNKYLGVNV